MDGINDLIKETQGKIPGSFHPVVESKMVIGYLSVKKQAVTSCRT